MQRSELMRASCLPFKTNAAASLRPRIVGPSGPDQQIGRANPATNPEPDQYRLAPSRKIRGVTKISSSSLLSVFVVVLNR
jgi:hypothetical protein